MAKIHGKRLFTGTENVKGRFFIDVAPVFEIEHPYRQCRHALFVRVWITKALIFGWWRQGDEVSNLLMAVRGSKINVRKEEEDFYRSGMGGRLPGCEEEDS